MDSPKSFPKTKNKLRNWTKPFAIVYKSVFTNHYIMTHIESINVIIDLDFLLVFRAMN